MNQPYFVLATQNPIEQEGTYPLPEAQLDRFMFAINLDYPSFSEEVEVVKQTTTNNNTTLDVVFDGKEVLEFQQLIRKTPVADNVIEYAVEIISKSRPKHRAPIWYQSICRLGCRTKSVSKFNFSFQNTCCTSWEIHSRY